MVFHRGQAKKQQQQQQQQTNKQKEPKVKFSESIMSIDVSMTPRHHFV